MPAKNSLQIVGTCPMISQRLTGPQYPNLVSQVATWADKDNWEAILVYADHRQADPWLTSQIIMQSTQQLRPLVAVQPVYAHPFAVAKAVSTLASLYHREVYLNFVAGGFPLDLEMLGDYTPHDQRYDRLVEYASIVRGLLLGNKAVSLSGSFYKVKNLRLDPSFPEGLSPSFMISGSSERGLRAAHEIGARAIHYLRVADDYLGVRLDPQLQHGARLGIIVRDTTEDAWSIARRRYPDNHNGTMLRELATEISDSVWVKELGKKGALRQGHTYWLQPYRTYQTSCPFLVGCFDDVVGELMVYILAGLRTLLVECPENQEDSKWITSAIRTAEARADSSTLPMPSTERAVPTTAE